MAEMPGGDACNAMVPFHEQDNVMAFDFSKSKYEDEDITRVNRFVISITGRSILFISRHVLWLLLYPFSSRDHTVVKFM